MLGYIATHAMNPALQTLAYDPVTDFAPVGLVGHSPTVLVTTAGDPVTTVADLIARLDAEPNRYRYASAGDGTAPHFAAELFKLNAGVEMHGSPTRDPLPHSATPSTDARRSCSPACSRA